MLTYIDWNVEPTILGTPIRYYSLFFAIAFWLGYTIVSKMFKDQKLPEDWVDKIFIYIVVATIIGSRLGHVFFYAWDYYKEHPIEIFKVWEGGLASHGGTIGIMLALWLYTKYVSHKSYLWVVDCATVPVALAAFFIRMGNLFNSEIYGIPSNVSWAFRFLRLRPELALIPRHPTQIYEALFYLCVFGLLWYLYWNKRMIERHGFLFGVFMICVFGFRMFIEVFKENQEAFEESMILNMGQILSIPFVLLGVGCLIYSLKQPRENIYGKKAS